MENEEKVEINLSEVKLSEVKGLVDQGLVKKDDILKFFGLEEKTEETETKEIKTVSEKHVSIAKILYFIGGVIILAGLTIFIAQFWSEWDQIIKVIFALGLSALLYGVGYFLHYKQQKSSIFSNISFILSSFLLPLGVGTFLDLLSTSATTSEGLSVNFAILFILYFLSYKLLKYDVFLIFSSATASALFITVTNSLVGEPTIAFYQYRLLILGIALISFGYYFELYRRVLVSFFYFFGFLLFLGSAFSLNFNSNFWLFVFPFLLVAAFYASVVLKNKLIVFLATIFTFAEIGWLTEKYFSRSLGWPLALIIAGFAIIMVGYFSFETTKKYIKK